MTTLDERELIDLGDYPIINAAGIADFYFLNDGRVRFLLYDWFRLNGLYRRQVVGIVTRSISNLREEIAWFCREAFELSPPNDGSIVRH